MTNYEDFSMLSSFERISKLNFDFQSKVAFGEIFFSDLIG